MRFRVVVLVGLGLTVAPVATHAQQASAAMQRTLTIVVIEGEGGVNIIQQKTAVAPVVEVRDRNNQPVAGSIVTFAIRGTRATFGGARTLTITTNAAGRAAVTELTPLSAGTFEISASAEFQGQSAAATITQTNVMTLAQAAPVVGGSSAGSGGASSGGGGWSATTLSVLAGAAAGGTLVAGKALDIGPFASNTRFTGSFTGQLILTTNGVSGGGTPYACVSTNAVSGTLRMELDDNGAGTADADGTRSELSRTAGEFCGPSGGAGSWGFTAAVTGAPTALMFTKQVSSTIAGSGATNTQTQTLAFSGALSDGAVSGTLTYSQTFVQTEGAAHLTESGSAAMPLTLR